jgi:hypothetical protein
VSEKEAAAVRRSGDPLTIAEQQLRQEASAVSKPPSQAQKEAAIAVVPQTAGPDPGDRARNDISRAGTPAARPAEVAQPAAEGVWDAS